MPPPEHNGTGSGLSGGLLVLTGLSLVWIYAFGLVSNPVRWEEPRRCLVAMEMISSGDYVVPHVMGEIYLKKPPLYNWLIVAAAGNRFEAADVVRARLVTLGALALVCLIVWRLGVAGDRARPDLWPAIMVATMATVVQLGRAGEIDIAFTFCTTAAIAAYEFGRRRGSPTLQWVVSQLFVAAGVLTKGIAPLFFYPPVLFCAWRFRRESRFRPVAFLVGLGAMALAVGVWVVPYSRAIPAGEIEGSWLKELVWVFKKAGVAGTLQHPITYPLVVLSAALPWTIYLFALGRGIRAEWSEKLRRDPYWTLAAAVVVWNVLVYVVVPGVASRYLIPMLPFVAVLIGGAIVRGGADQRMTKMCGHWGFWTATLVILLGYGVGGGKDVLRDPRIWISIVVGLVMIGAFAYLVFARGQRAATTPLLLLGLIYGVCFAGVWEARRASRTTPYVEVAREFAGSIDETTPIACDCSGKDALMLSYNLGQEVGRLVRHAPPPSGPYYLVAPTNRAPVPGARRLAERWRFGLSVVNPDLAAQPEEAP